MKIKFTYIIIFILQLISYININNAENQQNHSNDPLNINNNDNYYNIYNAHDIFQILKYASLIIPECYHYITYIYNLNITNSILKTSGQIIKVKNKLFNILNIILIKISFNLPSFKMNIDYETLLRKSIDFWYYERLATPIIQGNGEFINLTTNDHTELRLFVLNSSNVNIKSPLVIEVGSWGIPGDLEYRYTSNIFSNKGYTVISYVIYTKFILLFLIINMIYIF